jgi:small-conductance mechanosensitive channel
VSSVEYSPKVIAATGSFWSNHGDEVSAAITLAVAVGLAMAVDRFLFGRAQHAAESKDTAEFSREARTRLRLIRRLVFVVIILLGIALALSQFASIKRFATGVLASTAVLGLIIGFAARTVIANFVAGVLMAVRQPIRIGDRISIGEEVDGRVTDIALTYTSVDTGEGALAIVPNEMVINQVVVNNSRGNRVAPATVEVWVPPETDVEAARRALDGTAVTSVHLAELTHEGARLELKAPIEPGADRQARETEVRELAQGALRDAGLLEHH